MKSTQSLYITGGTIPGDAHCYILREADELLFAKLRSGEFCYVLTPRQTGKSSLVEHTSQRLLQEDAHVARVDLQNIGLNMTADQWYVGLLDSVGRQLHLQKKMDDFILAHENLSPLQLWQQALRDIVLVHLTGPIVIFIDEIDTVRSLQFSCDEFFGAIRACYNARSENQDYKRLTFCLLGVSTPADLIHDPHLTPFNIGCRVDLHDFTPDEATLLQSGLGHDATTNCLLMKRIYYWTGGHPYLTQRLCKTIAENGTIRTPKGVDACCRQTFLMPTGLSRGDNLDFVQQRLLPEEEDKRATLLTLYQQIRNGKKVADKEAEALIGTLKLSGVVRAKGGFLVPRNRIYAYVFDRKWILANMPNAEIRRQRGAYRVGVLRTVLVFGAILIVMVVLLFTVNYQAQRAEHQLSLAKRLNYAGDIVLAQKAWEEGSVGRADELLEAWLLTGGTTDMPAFEWRYLWRLAHNDIRTLKHHPGPGEDEKIIVFSVAYSPDESILASGGKDQIIKLWDTTTWQATEIVTGHTGLILNIRFSPDGRQLVSSSKDGTVRLWNVKTRRQIGPPLMKENSSAQGLSYSRDGKLLAAAFHDGTVLVQDVSSRREVQRLRDPMGVGFEFLAFSPNGKYLAAPSGHAICVWDTSSWNPRHLPRTGNPPNSGVTFSPDSKTLAAAGDNNSILLWDVATWTRRKRRLGSDGLVVDLAFSPDGKMLASASWDDHVRLWDWSTGKLLADMRGHTERVNSVVFSRDGKTLVSGGGNDIKLWNIEEQERSPVLSGHEAGVACLAVSPDGKFIASLDLSGVIKLWDATTQTLRYTLNQRRHIESDAPFLNHCLTFASDGNTLVSADAFQPVRRWNIQTGKEIDNPPSLRINKLGAVLSPTGQMAAVKPSKTRVEVWDLIKHAKVTTIDPVDPQTFVRGFTLDGKQCVMAEEKPQYILRFWDIATQRYVKMFGKLPKAVHENSILDVAFSPDGKTMASVSWDRSVRIWDVETQQQTALLKGHRGPIRCVAFSPDGKTLATGSEDHDIKLWDIASQREILTLKGHRDNVHSVVFSADGNLLVSASQDKTVRLWRAADLKTTRTTADRH